MTDLVGDLVGRMKGNKECLSERHLDALRANDLKNLRCNLSRKTREERIRKMVQLVVEVGKEFEDMCEEDLQGFLDGLRGRGVQSSTIETCKAHFRKFFEDSPLGDAGCLRFVKFRYRYKTSRDMLSEEEVLRLVSACAGVQGKAVLSVLWETGCRVGELLNCNVGDYVQVGEHVKLVLNGKTGIRERELITAVPYMERWMEEHPHRGRLEMPLFVSRNHFRFHRRMSRDGVVEVIKQAKAKCGLCRRVTPHIFRHSRATFLAPFLSEMEMREYFGWSKDSSMPAVYIHLSGKQVNEKYRGIVTGEKRRVEPRRSVFLERTCPRCGHVNVGHALYCARCFLPIDGKAVDYDMRVTTAFKSAYVRKFLKIDVDRIVDEFYYFRGFVQEMMVFKQAFRGCRRMSLSQLRENTGWSKEKFTEFVDRLRGSGHFEFGVDGSVEIVEFTDPSTGHRMTFFDSYEWLNDALLQGGSR